MATIRELASAHRILYYPEFAYLHPEHWVPTAATPSAVSAGVTRHLRNIKRSLIVFDAIYLPVSHLLFQPTSARALIAQALLVDPIFRSIVERGIVITDLWDPTLAADLVEYRQEYLSAIDWPIEPRWTPEAVQIIQQFTHAERNVTAQSTQLAADFDNYIAERSRMLRRPTLESLRSIREKSSYKTLVPFAHERFTLELHTLSTQHPSLEAEWRGMNDLYWSRAEQDYGTAVYSTANNHDYCRLTKMACDPTTRVSSCLYRPEVILWFLEALIGELALYLDELPVDALIALRRDEWWAFLDRYHSFLTVLTEITQQAEEPHPSREHLIVLFRQHLIRNSDSALLRWLGLPVSLLTMAVNLVAAHGAGPIAKSSLDPLPWEDWFRRAMLEARHPDIASFLELSRMVFEKQRRSSVRRRARQMLQ